MADSGTGGFGGVHVLYGVVIGEAIARGDVTQMQKVLADSKSLLASQGDLKTQISNLEAAISQVTRGPGGGAAASKGDGLFVVDLKSLALPPERLEAIQSAIRDVVVNALADLDQVVTRGPEAFGPPHTMGIVIRDI